METRLLADIRSPWNHLAKRFIEAPVFCLEPEPNVGWYRFEMLQDGRRFVVENDKPIIDTAPIWDSIRIGVWANAQVFLLEERGGWCIKRYPIGARGDKIHNIGFIARAPDWEDHEEAPLDYASAVRRNLDWFDSLEANPNAYYREPGMPAWWWHACESRAPHREKFFKQSFPALSSVAIKAYLKAERCFPDRAAHYRRIAVAIGDWLIRNRTPMDGAAPGMPWTTIEEGRFGGLAEKDVINLSRAFRPAQGMLSLYLATGERKYLEYAQHIAGIMLKFLKPDGAMPYRIRPQTGEVVEEHTVGHTHAAEFLDRLNSIAPDSRLEDGVRRIIGWLLANPLVDCNWRACFEDVGKGGAYSNPSSLDALSAVRLLCRHSAEDPALLRHALKAMRWVEDQFVNFGDEPSLVVKTYYPAVREQWVCDFNMEGHSCNYAAACLALHRATGDGVWARKRIATFNAILKAQRRDGAFSTWGVDRETGLTGYGGHGENFMNAGQTAIAELLSHVLMTRGETVSPDEGI